jgi:hypothetical protein
VKNRINAPDAASFIRANKIKSRNDSFVPEGWKISLSISGEAVGGALCAGQSRRNATKQKRPGEPGR